MQKISDIGNPKLKKAHLLNSLLSLDLKNSILWAFRITDHIEITLP